VIQNASMSFSAFVETKFVPEHVQHKTLAGRTHYQAMLKHLISPEIVHRMFNAEGISKARLQSIPGWPYLDQVRLCDLTAEHVRSLVAAAFARNYAWQTVKHIKNVAFAIIAHAQQEGCFHRLNPGSHVKLPPRTHRAKPDLTMSQARAILQLLPSPEKHIAFLALSTGMNIQEICNLQWKHVNLANSPRVLEGEIIPPYCIAVRTHWNPAGLGNASTRRNRNIALSARLFAVLADWALEKRALNPEEFVLVSDTGQPILRANLRSSRLVTTGRKLGIPWLSWRVLCRAHFVNLSEFWASTRPHGWQRDVEWIDRVPAEETI
jgi:integrase